MRRGLGILIVVGGGALLWLLKKGLRHGNVHTTDVVIGPKKGVCGVTEPPRDVTMKRHEQLHWKITNGGGAPCNGPVEVCIANWRPANPLEEVGGDGRFCRTVRPGQTKTLPARVKPGTDPGHYHYDIWINGQPAVDPMVQIVV